MAERRSLVEGIKPDRSVEEHFVRSGKLTPADAAPLATDTAMPGEAKTRRTNTMGRAPLTTRIRSDFGAALKRASLERQLNGITPHTLQDILEEALEPWLRKNGYLQ